MIVEFFERVCHRCRRSPRPFSYSTRKTRSTVVLVDSTDCALSELLGKTFMVVFPHTLVVMCKEVADVLCGGRIIAVLGRSRWIGKSRHLGSSQSGGAYSYHNSLRLQCWQVYNDAKHVDVYVSISSSQNPSAVSLSILVGM